MPVDSFEFGMSPYGCYNMAGNVSEWCFNQQEEGFSAPGGSWQDPAYMFGRISAFPGFYSSSSLGFRCALTSPGATSDQGGMKIVTKTDAAVFVPSKAVSFETLASHYRYEKTPLDPQIIEVIETEAWRREKITLAGAAGERAIAYLYLPKNAQKPFQAIVFGLPDGFAMQYSLSSEFLCTATDCVAAGRIALQKPVWAAARAELESRHVFLATHSRSVESGLGERQESRGDYAPLDRLGCQLACDCRLWKQQEEQQCKLNVDTLRQREPDDRG